MNEKTKLKEIKKEIKMYHYYSKKLDKVISVRKHNRKYYIRDVGSRWKRVDPVNYGLTGLKEARKLDWLKKFEPQQTGMCSICGEENVPIREEKEKFDDRVFNYCKECWLRYFPEYDYENYKSYEEIEEDALRDEEKYLENDIKELLSGVGISTTVLTKKYKKNLRILKENYKKNLDQLSKKGDVEGKFISDDLRTLKSSIEERINREYFYDTFGLSSSIRKELEKSKAFPCAQLNEWGDLHGRGSFSKMFKSPYLTDEEKLGELKKLCDIAEKETGVYKIYKTRLKLSEVILKDAEEKWNEKAEKERKKEKIKGEIHEKKWGKIWDYTPKLRSGERYYALWKKDPSTKCSSTKDKGKAVNVIINDEHAIVIAKSPKDARKKYAQRNKEV